MASSDQLQQNKHSMVQRSPERFLKAPDRNEWIQRVEIGNKFCQGFITFGVKKSQEDFWV